VPPGLGLSTVGSGVFCRRSRLPLPDVAQDMLDRAGKSAQAGALARRLVAATSNRGKRCGPSVTTLPGPSERPDRTSENFLWNTLSDADTTLADGYGHTADRAILLHAMLSAAGFSRNSCSPRTCLPLPAFPRWRQPFPAYGFPKSAGAVVVDGTPYYLNDTDQYGRLGSTPHDGMLALTVPSGAYQTIRPHRISRAATTTTYTLSFADNSKARIGIRKRVLWLGF